MGHSKKKNGAKTAQLRSRQTRSTKGRLILSDPAQNTQLLTTQLSALGLYPANTIGDGNCLFRALSDQVYGTDSHHARLRQEICDWIEKNGARYEPFVEDERGLETHLRCMRENATYGGHMELSAFAHMSRRNVKVIQPGLVYVIEWDAGGIAAASTSSSTDLSFSAVYVAYHDWEHFSSIRNMNGPHSGMPNVCEIPGNDETPVPPAPIKKEKLYKVKSKGVPKSKRKGTSAAAEDNGGPSTPREIPLPPSRSTSPGDDELLPIFSPFPRPSSSSLHDGPTRTNRSPKRSFDESSAGTSASIESSAKRSRSSRLRPDENDTSNHGDVEMTITTDSSSTPGLSAPGSSSSAASSPLSALEDEEAADAGDESSDLSELSDSDEEDVEHITVPPPPPIRSPSPPPPPALTRRQRKALGLPKPRVTLTQSRVVGGGAGKIIIPGGRFKRRDNAEAATPETPDSAGEWRTNGTGRVDVRGFRELKI